MIGAEEAELKLVGKRRRGSTRRYGLTHSLAATGSAESALFVLLMFHQLHDAHS